MGAENGVALMEKLFLRLSKYSLLYRNIFANIPCINLYLKKANENPIRILLVQLDLDREDGEGHPDHAAPAQIIVKADQI